MANFIAFNRDQSYLLPPDVKSWLPADDMAHFVVAVVDRVKLDRFVTPVRTGGKPQYHPRLMLALLIYCYANGIFSSRRIERATCRDIAVRFVAANLHPDHDTIAVFRRSNQAAIEAAFLQLLLLARESGLLRLGAVSIDGTKIDANASKIRSIRYDRAKELRAKADAAAARPAYEARKAAHDAKKGRRGKPPAPPDDAPPPDRQINLTDPDSALMRRAEAHEYRQAYNAQAVVCAAGSQLIVATHLVATSADAPSFAETILGMADNIGLPVRVLADTGYASGPAVARLKDRQIEPWVAIGRTQPHRRYDLRPPPEPKAKRTITEPWRLEMKAKLQTEEGKNQYSLRKQTVEPVFGIIKRAIRFTYFHRRGIANVTSQWRLVAWAYNCKRLARLSAP